MVCPHIEGARTGIRRLRIKFSCEMDFGTQCRKKRDFEVPMGQN